MPADWEDEQDADDMEDAGTDIAVVGMACRVPGANDAAQYWDNLREGRESILSLSDDDLLRAGARRKDLRDPSFVKRSAILDDIDKFDAGFFGFSPREAQVLDPQHRFFLEVCWEALEHAGHIPENFPGAVGVFGGSGHNAYMPLHLFTNPELMESMGLFLVRHTGNDKDFLVTRASYCLDLRGPAVNVQTACSTSLVAIHLGAQSLLSGECDMALAGGVTIELPHGRGYRFEEGEILSPDGHCRAFDHRSAGTVFGSGCGIVALRRLQDAIDDGDTIYGVVKATAINNDGSRKVGYLAPSVDGQAEAIVEAITLSGLEARDISYVECHGTGTPVGDPIEVTALTQAFRTTTEDSGFCRIGSVKTNIGHLDTAAGVASFIKVVQMLRHHEMAPTLHYEAPNPTIDLASSPFLVNDKLRAWTSPSALRRAGVSSLGVGGTNAHIIVEEPPASAPSVPPLRQPQLLVVSGRTERALENNIERLSSFLEVENLTGTALADAANTLLVGRRRHACRRAVVVDSGADARAAFADVDVRAKAGAKTDWAASGVCFLFPGGGAQYPGMMREIYDEEEVFRAQLDACLRIVKEREGIDLVPLLFPVEGDAAAFEAAAAELKRATRALPALLSIEVALAALWKAWGIEPTMMIGHSLGEYAAAYLAGVFSLEDALGIVSCRGRLFEKCPAGAMTAVPLSETEIRKRLPAELDIAVVNAPESCVVSGPTADVAAFENKLATDEIEAKRLAIDVAAHSRMLDEVLEEFRTYLANVRFQSPDAERPFVSNLSGAIAGEEVATADYWARHLRSTVRFADGLGALLAAKPETLLLEVGPGQALTQIARMHPDVDAPWRTIPSSRHARDSETPELKHLLLAGGRLWCGGAALDVEKWVGADRRRIALPTYAFDHDVHWVEPGTRFFTHHEEEDDAARSDDVGAWFSAPTFRAGALPPETMAGTFVVMSDASGHGDTLAKELRRRGNKAFTVRPGSEFVMTNDLVTVRTTSAGGDGADLDVLSEDLSSLFDTLSSAGTPVDRVIHMWSLDAPATNGVASLGAEEFEAAARSAHGSSVAVLRALADADLTPEAAFVQVTSGAVAVADEETPGLFGTLGLGPVRVGPKELPEIRAALVDVAFGAAGNPMGALADEVTSTLKDELVAIREAGRYIEAWDAVPMATASPADFSGTLVVTGGLGGIGLAIANSFARPGVRLALVGRTELPPRPDWDEHLQTNVGDKTSSRIVAVRELERLGAEVDVIAADVIDSSALAQALGAIGPIHGAVHAAGTLDDKPLALKSEAEMHAVMSPKVLGLFALEQALEGQPLKFFVAFSSTSAVLGPPGQVDYVAANAFLNARMASNRRAGLPALALGWGVWREVGMAADAAGANLVATGTPVPHPLLQRRAEKTANGARFEAIYDDTLWPLAEHRVRGGDAIVPGTGIVEIVRAAASESFEDFHDVDLTVQDVRFLAPLALENGNAIQVLITTTRTDETVQVRIQARASGADDYEDRAEGVVTKRATGEQDPPKPLDIKALDARCTEDQQVFSDAAGSLPQERLLDFGPRWQVLRQIAFGPEEAVARVSLAPDFRRDLDTFLIHPGLWDIASGFAFSHFPAPSEASIYVPVSYGEIRLFSTQFSTPPSSVVSHIRFAPAAASEGAATESSGGRIRVDMTLADEAGRVFAEVKNYIMMPVEASALAPARMTSTQTPLERLLESGIRPEEGAEAFARAVKGPHSIVVASPLEFSVLQKEFAAPKLQGASGAGDLDGGDIGPATGGPRDDTERTILGLFRDLLGANQASIHDSFFDLGGHSLIAVRLFSRLKKASGVDLPIGTLFVAPSAEALAVEIRNELGISFVPDESSSSSPAAAAPPSSERGPACLVPINRGSDDSPAFFCVHGAGGNVMNFTDLSRYLGAEIAFYGLQAKGVDGKEPPLESIEEMATYYLEGVRHARPHGPYVLGGYSGGGAVAFEMAHRLEAAGETVEAVVFLDTFRPGIGMQRPSLKKRFKSLRAEGPAAYFRERIRSRANREWTQASYEVQRRIFEKAGAPPPIELRDFLLSKAFAAAADRYRPRPYDGRVVLFRAEETDEVYKHSGPTLGWHGIARQLEVHEVPGDHDSVTREPNIFEWIDRLRAIVEGASDVSDSTE